MRRLVVLAGFLAIAGCGGDPAAQLNGSWHVDPATVTNTRLAPGQEVNPQWTATKAALGKVKVDFDSSKDTVRAVGFGKTTTGSWKLAGSQIEVTTDESWPSMTFDKDAARIHSTMKKGEDSLTFDLVKG